MTPPRSDTRVTGDAEAHHSASSSDRDASNDGASPPPNPPESVPAPSSRGPDVFANTAIMESVVRFAAREGRMGDVYRICLVNRQGVSVANRILYSRIPGWVANEGRVPTEVRPFSGRSSAGHRGVLGIMWFEPRIELTSSVSVGSNG